MKAPKKIYLCKDALIDFEELGTKRFSDDIEYTCTDVFIEKVCEFWKDHLAGYDICEDDIERSVESFKLAMKL